MASQAMQTIVADPPLSGSVSLTVVPVQGESPKRAQVVAEELGCPFSQFSEPSKLHLVVGETDAYLVLDRTIVRLQFDSAAMRHRRKGGQNELLGRAIGVKADRQPVVWDATGGLGRDAFVLADLGCRVTVCEREPVLAWLLKAAQSAALVSSYDQVREAADQMTVLAADSCQCDVSEGAVIYLDPMFPERRKAAAVKKEAVLLQHLADTADDGEGLWEWALQQPASRIVVKRPLRAPVLGTQSPSHSLTGKSVRFDVFVRPSAIVAGADKGSVM